RQIGERVDSAAAAEEAGDDRRVDDGLAVAQAAQCVDEIDRVEDALLEQVADTLRPVFEEPQGVAWLDVLGEDEHTDVGVVAADRSGDGQPFVRVRRGHADVDDDGVGMGQSDVAQERICVLGLGDDVDAGLLEQVNDALAREQVVVGDDYAHGMPARSVVVSASTEPPSAPTRSLSWVGGAPRRFPSSRATTTSWSSRSRTSTLTN